jgi:hypothetical protein
VKKTSTLAIAAALALSAGAALAAPLSLYRIELKPGTDAYRFAAQHRMPVYHIGRSLLLSGAPADAFRPAEVAGQFLVYRGDSRDLRWLHQKRGGPALDGSIQPLFQDEGLALVRSSDLAGIRTSGLVAVEFPEQPIPLVLQSTLVNPGLEYDPAINALAQQITVEHFRADVETLQAFNTRNSGANTNHLTAEWIRQKFQSFGIADVVVDSFIDPGFSGSIKIRNVIATLPGTADTHTVYVVGGHFDSCVWPFNPSDPWAPGADDNGSGTAAALELARVMAANPPQATVQFVAFDCEEWGLFGSKKSANDALAAGKSIGCMLNYDMIAAEGNDSLFVSKVYPGSEAQAQLLGQSALWYGATGDTSLVPVYNSVYLNGSDSWRYHVNGYRVTYSEELYFSDHYHMISDSTTYMNMRYGASIVRAGAGMLGTMASYPQAVAGLLAQDLGDGSRALVSWQANAAANVVGYRVMWGLASGNYADSATVAGISDTIAGLTTDVAYYVGIKALDASGRQSPLVSEVSVTPRSVPLAPAGLAAAPQAVGIALTWRGNQELDLAGYRLYRAVNDTLAFDSLNTTLLADTVYADSALSGADRYYYKVRAFDLDGNAGSLSNRAYGRPATLDQGILVVDETKNWTTGTWPRDPAQDSLYEYILGGLAHQQHDLGSAADRPLLADLVPFSTILWHGDDYTELLASGSVTDLRKYLDFGGNLWITGWKIAGNLRGSASYPFAPPDTSFLKGYLKIGSVDQSGNNDSFQLAQGLLGYPDIAVDTLKVPVTSWGKTMRWTEAYTPATGGEAVYHIDLRNSGSPYQGLPCGVRYLGPTYKTVLFGFPLLFMERDQARAAAVQVMSDFGETGVAQGPVAELKVESLKLLPNTPNPFSRATTIHYQMPRAGNVSLRVYNVAGQAVRTLVSGSLPAGAHSARWDGRDDRGRALPGGVYFARLAASEGSRTIKITMLK